MYWKGQTGEELLGVEFHTGANSERRWPIEELYVCDSCDVLVSRHELVDEFDSYYCMQCLDNMPSSEATAFGNRCSKCFDCPRCFQILIVVPMTGNSSQMIAGIERAKSNESSQPDSKNLESPLEVWYQFYCQFCRWESTFVGLTSTSAADLPGVAIKYERQAPSSLQFQKLILALKKPATHSDPSRVSPSQLGKRGVTPTSGFAPSLSGVARARAASSATSDGMEENSGRGQPQVWRLHHLKTLLEAREKSQRQRKVWDSAAGLMAVNHTKQTDGPNSVAAADGADVSSSEGQPPSSKLYVTLSELLDSQESAVDLRAKLKSLDHPLDQGRTIDQILRRPNDLAQTSQDFLPSRKSLLTKRSHRCRKCQRLVVRAHVNPVAQYKDKNNTAMACIPSLVLVRCGLAGTTSPNKRGPSFKSLSLSADGWCEFELQNLTDFQFTVRLKQAAVAVQSVARSTLTVLTAGGEVSIPPFDEFAEVGAENSQKAEESDPPFVVGRSNHVITIRLDLRPHDDITPGSPARFCLSMEVVTPQTTIQTTPVVSLGLLIA